MKANEVPEKLYYAPYGDIRENHPITDNDIEYTRTDTFIKKACEWLDSIMYYVSKEDKRLVCDFTDFDGLVNDFKKAMGKYEHLEHTVRKGPLERTC